MAIINESAGQAPAADTPARRVLDEIATERQCQDERWGEQNNPDGTAAVSGSSPRAQEPERRRARVVPYAERQPLYAAYAAARKWAEEHGEEYTDDGIIQAAVKAYAAAVQPPAADTPTPATDAPTEEVRSDG